MEEVLVLYTSPCTEYTVPGYMKRRGYFYDAGAGGLERKTRIASKENLSLAALP